MQPATRALALLASSFGLAWVAIAMTAAPGPAAWVQLSGDTRDSGHYFATFSLSAAAGVGLAGRFMDRVGRRPVLIAAHLVAAAGYAGAGLSYAAGALLPFAACTAALAAALGAVSLTRLAAGEMFPPERRARAVGNVQVAATFGAVLGPLLLVVAAFAPAPDRLVWFLAPPALLAAAALVWAAPEPMRLAHKAAGPAPRLDAPILRRPLAAGVVALACAQAGMVAVMGVAGVALDDHGYPPSATGLVMAAHFLGMFALSPVVGMIADRFGRRNTIVAGLALLAAGGATVALVPGAGGLAVGLLLIGLGWSFAYIGGTVLVTDAVPAARRARVLGLSDLSTALLAAGTAIAGGAWYHARGLEGLGLVAVAAAAVPLVLALMLKEREPGRFAVPSAS